MNPDEQKHDNLKAVVDSVERSQISSIKTVVSGIVNTISDPRSTTKDLQDIIEVDPPLTAKVLKIANSAYYSSPKRISEIRQALIWIGTDAIRELALGQKVCEIFQKDEVVHGYSRIMLWKHSIAVALLAKMIFRKQFGQKGESIYAAGLMHDIGIIVEDQFLQNDFKHILSKTKDEKKNLSKAEYEVLGYTHTDVAREITNRWDFPQELVVSIGDHHRPNKTTQEFLRFGSTLYLADYLCQIRGIGYADAPFHDKAAFQQCLKNLGVMPRALKIIVKDMELEISKMEDQGLIPV